MWKHAAWIVVVGCGDGGTADGAGGPRLNELQAIGTHNSYHLLAGEPADPALNYVHDPLPTQLDLGVRHFELDAHRAVDGTVMVYHIKTIDEASSCGTLAECLRQIRDWSDDHPDHHALFVIVEPKDDLARIAIETGNDPAAFGELLWDDHIADIDPVIRAAWPDRLLTPADLRGDAATLREAIADGWPSVDETRQQLIVVLNDTSALRDEYEAVAEPACFVFGEVDDDAVFMKADNSREDPARVAAGLAAGMIARSRADGDTEVDPAETAAALSSGAQLISTDYPVAREDGAHPGYRVPWPGTPEHPSRCNPVTAKPDCRDADIE